MMKSNMPVIRMIKIVLFISLVVGTGLTCLYPIPEYADNMWLQHIGTLLLLIPLLFDSIKNRLPLSAYICLTCFTVLHIVGARYIYSYVPYQEWLSAIGINSDLFIAVMDFGTKSRHCNQYDRLVHFAFGVLMFPCLLHVTKKWVGQKPLVAILFSWLLVQAFSMIYEIFEWQLSVWCDGGDAYNGQQGDIWDAQKDMALAMIGSTIMAVFYSCKKRCLAAVTSVTVLGSMTGCVMVPVGRGAAGPDLAEAQCALGVMYAEGQGVAKDDVAAVRWYQKAARQGNVDTQKALQDRGLAW